MSDFLLSILLGIVEGLTEFLPVSSTAHLRIVEAVLRLDLHDSFWKMYTIVIQLGAILALPVYFWRRILQFASTFPQGERGNRNIFTHPHDRGRASGRHVASGRAGVFVFPVDADDDRRDRLRFAQSDRTESKNRR